jgi:diguanylate cyclase (GGDEF)-like protein/PAS domain S-box-containing protein
VRRERLLGRAGKALAAAVDAGCAGEVAAGAAHALSRNAGVDGRLHAAVYVGDGDVLALVAQCGESPVPTPPLLDLRRLDGAAVGDDGSGTRTAVLPGRQLAAAGAGGGVPSPPFAHVLWAPLFARDRLRGIIAVSTDVTPDAGLRDAVEALGVDAVLVLDALESGERAESQARQVQVLLANSSDAITVLDADHVVRFDSSDGRLLGWSSEELLGQDAGFLAHPDDLPYLSRALVRIAEAPGATVACEWRARHRDGGWIRLESVFTNLLEDVDVRGFLVNSRDVSERAALQDQLAHQSLHDPLTGLPNRTLFVDRVAHALERSKRRTTAPALCMVDLDGFKGINETYGHEVADRVLAVVAERLQGSLRQGDTPARLGGDVFGVLMEDLEEEAIATVVGRLLAALSRPVAVDGRDLAVQATIGVATPKPGWTTRELVQAAEAALHGGKAVGRGTWRRYDASLPEPGAQRQLVADLDLALERRQLRLQYQPVVDLATGEVTAVEALLRWQHPERGTVPPNEFIPLAERTGAIVPIGRWVLETATAQVRRWHEADPDRRPLAVHVNVSAVQLADVEAVEELGRVIARSGIDPGLVTLEITESVLVADPTAAVQRLARLKALGVRLAIDDFGVGYAGLGYLRHFAVDQLKIDKSFVDGLRASGSTALFEAILGFSQAFGLEAVAEGVEEPEQVAILGQLGCANAQGFHFARPLDPADLERLLAGGTVPSWSGREPSGGGTGTTS